MLLILAAVSLNAVFSDKGIFNRAEDAGLKYNEAKAREVLETVLLVDGQYEKNINPAYNQDDFLDELIKREIEGADVKGDIAIISGKYAYELDRSVPKIGKYLGNSKDLIWPEVVIVNEPTLIENGRKSRFKIRATIDEKATKGITRIELWLNGKKLDQDRKYDNEQREVEEEYTVSRNGVYTIKTYAELMGSNKVTVEGIVPAVRFSPDGNTEWKKQHTTEIIVEETAETITEMKYIWTNSEDEPTEFTTDCLNNRIVTGGNETMTGTYYLWVMVKTNTGKINICGSEGFNFDNEGPTIRDFNYNPTSATSYNLSCQAEDTYSDIERYEVYINGVCVAQLETNEKIYNTNELNEVKDNTTKYEIKVYDKLGNSSLSNLTNRSDIQIWKKSEFLQKMDGYYFERISTSQYSYGGSSQGEWSYSRDVIVTEDECHFAYPEEGDMFAAMEQGRTVYTKTVNSDSLVRYDSYRYAGLNKVMTATSDRVVRKWKDAPGQFLGYENYGPNFNKPTNGEWNGFFYEFLGNPS